MKSNSPILVSTASPSYCLRQSGLDMYLLFWDPASCHWEEFNIQSRFRPDFCSFFYVYIAEDHGFIAYSEMASSIISNTSRTAYI